MNEKVKKIFVGIGLVAGAVLAFIMGRGWNNPLRKRISDAQDCVADGRRTTDEIRDSNRQLAESVEGIKGKVDDVADGMSELADRVRESASTADEAGRAVDNAHDAVRFSLGVLEQAEKRRNEK